VRSIPEVMQWSEQRGAGTLRSGGSRKTVIAYRVILSEELETIPIK
jgi:hypothetical protein